MEEKTITELLKTMAVQSPGLVAAMVLAWMVMKHLTKRQEFEREMHNEHIDERKQGRLAAQEHAQALRVFATELQKNMFEMQRNTESNNNLTNMLARTKMDQMLARTKGDPTP